MADEDAATYARDGETAFTWSKFYERKPYQLLPTFFVSQQHIVVQCMSIQHMTSTQIKPGLKFYKTSLASSNMHSKKSYITFQTALLLIQFCSYYSVSTYISSADSQTRQHPIQDVAELSCVDDHRRKQRLWKGYFIGGSKERSSSDCHGTKSRELG